MAKKTDNTTDAEGNVTHTAEELSGADLKSERDAQASNADVKKVSVTLPGGTKVTGPAEAVKASK